MKMDLLETLGAAMTEGRWADVLAHVSPDVVTHVPAVGTLHGIDELAAFQLDVAAKADTEEQLELLKSQLAGTISRRRALRRVLLPHHRDPGRP